jgi:hypothetical protein
LGLRERLRSRYPVVERLHDGSGERYFALGRFASCIQAVMSKLVGALSSRGGTASRAPAAWLGADITEPDSRLTYS